MTKRHLSACPACARHVRVSETSCPFCGVTLNEEFRTRPPPRTVAGRFSRAALYALGASSLTMAGACEVSSESLYGAPIVDSGDFQPDTLPPLLDSGHDSSHDVADSGPHDSHLMVDAAYGDAPPFDSGLDGSDEGDGETD